MNNISGISSRMDKWLGRQNGESHCHKTEYRKKNNEKKKWRQPKRSLDNIKFTNTCIIGVAEWDEREKSFEKIFEEIMAENFLYMWKEIFKSKKHTKSQADKLENEHRETHNN